MNAIDFELEQLYKTAGSHLQRKGEDTLTSWDRDIYWYDRDEVNRQAATATTSKVTYEQHRKAVETAVNMMRKSTPHEVAMCILTHRFFTAYRSSLFGGEGNFITDYTAIIKRVGALFNGQAGKLMTISISTKLAEFKVPTLVLVNHISGYVKKVSVPSAKFTLTEWALKYNENCVESSSYIVAGLALPSGQ